MNRFPAPVTRPALARLVPACAGLLVALASIGCSDDNSSPLAPDPGTPAPVASSLPKGTPIPGRIAFSSEVTGDMEIYTMNPDGSGLRRLTYNHGAADLQPTWSPDGRKIAFVSQRDAGNDVFTMNADGTRLRRLTAFGTSGIRSQPAWSGDGKLIAFASTHEGGQSDIYVMNASGSNLRRLTSHPAEDVDPSWSPDGGQIAFTSNRSGSSDVHVMKADGSDERNFSNCPDPDDSCFGPAWSPDGTRLAYVKSGQIAVHRLDQSAGSLLPFAGVDPAWSPDGVRLVFVNVFTDPAGQSREDLFTIFGDGTDPQQITFTASDEGSPSWGR